MNSVVSAVGGMAILLAYGLDIKETDDPHVKRAETAMESILATTVSGTYLVDILPIVRYVPSWFPGAAFQKQAKAGRKIQEDFRHLPYEQTIRNIVRLVSQKHPLYDSGFWLTDNRPLEVLSPHLWLMPSPISTRRETWRVRKPSSRTLRAMSSSVGHFFSDPLSTQYLSESSR